MSDDLISRQTLIENLNRFAPEHFNALINGLILKQPSVDRPKGKWIKSDNPYFNFRQCSNCGYGEDARYPASNFCAECGSDMRGEEHG